MNEAYIALFRDKKFRTVCLAAIVCMCAVALYSFICTPFTGDIKVFFAAANQVKYQESSGLLAVFEAWELKGIASRFLTWLLYLVADLFVGYENKIAFEYASKTCYGIFILFFLFLTVYLLPLEKRQKLTVFFISFISFFTVNSVIQLQVEATCVVLCLFCSACILHKKRGVSFCQALSG